MPSKGQIEYMRQKAHQMRAGHINQLQARNDALAEQVRELTRERHGLRSMLGQLRKRLGLQSED